MKLVRITAKNFAALADAEMTFDFELGVLFGPNGAGKSSVFEAMSFALWDKCRAPISALARYGARPVEVLCEFEEQGVLYRVIRTLATGGGSVQFFVKDGEEWKSLTGRKQEETKVELAKVLRTSYDTFLCTSFFRQNAADLFMAKGPADRGKVLREILEQDRWEVWASIARKRLTENTTDLKALHTTIAALRGQVSEEDPLPYVEALTKSIETAKADLAQEQEMREKIRKRMEELEESLSSLTLERSNHSHIVTSFESRYRDAKTKADRLNGIDSCPFCLSPVDTHKRHSIKEQLLGEVEKDRDSYAIAKHEIERLDKERGQVEGKRLLGQGMARKSEESLSSLRSKIQIDSANLSKWQTLRDTNEKIQLSISEKEASIESIEKVSEDLKVVVKLFSAEGVPANLVRLVVPSLEELSNELLERLTQGQFQIKIRTGGGGARETFEVDILDGSYTRPYETYSGGEQFRINFAVRVALSLLLSRMRGATSRCLFIDEGFGSQDEEGRKLLAECIMGIQEYFDFILAITHMEDLRDAFPTKFEAIPHEEGSIIQRIAQ